VSLSRYFVFRNLDEYRHKSHTLLKTRFFGLNLRRIHYGSIFNHFYVSYRKAAEFGRIIEYVSVIKIQFALIDYILQLIIITHYPDEVENG